MAAIKRRQFKFEVEKKYTHVKRFKEIKKSDLQLFLEALFKKKEEKKPELREEEKREEKLSAVKIIVIGLFLFILILAGIIFYILSLPPIVPHAEEKIPAHFINVLKSGTASYGAEFSPRTVAYSILETNATNIKLNFYTSPVSNQVFILECGKYQSQNNYPYFEGVLKNSLEEKGFSVGKISAEEALSIPEGAVVIAPCGKFPKELMVPEFSSFVRRGNTFVYIGLEPNQAIDLDGSLTSVPSSFWKTFNINFERVGMTCNASLKDPLYKAGSLIRGCISVVDYGEGSIIFVPQALDVGWDSGTHAAEDVEKILSGTEWLKPKYESSLTTNQTNILVFVDSEKTGYLKVYSTTDKGELTYAVFRQIFTDVAGELYVSEGPAVLSPTLSGAPLNFHAFINDGGEQRSLFLDVVNLQGENVEKISLGVHPLSSDFIFSYAGTLPEGAYLCEINDGQKAYARGIFSISPIEIKTQTNFMESKYTFSFFVGDKKVSLRNVKIKFRDKTYQYSNVNSVELDLSREFGGPTPTGSYDFIFTIGGEQKTVTVVRRETGGLSTIFTPLNILLFSIALAIVAIGVYFARKEEAPYALDIPAFPPIEKIKIPIKRKEVLEIFKKVNDFYKWKYTPLKLAEIKGGFKSIYYQGKPIYLSDYNLEFILDKLERRGDVKSYLEYYGLTEWEKESGRSIPVLCMFRAIRDICVVNAIPFSDLGRAKDCDTKLKVIGQDFYINFYEKGRMTEVMKNSTECAKKGVSIILFGSQEEKESFIPYVYSPNRLSGILKFYVESGDVLLLTVDELRKKIKEIKG
ncbi:MAG: hypothetical protein QXY05_00925 [Candidatus Anstonellales archaeon]